VEFRKEMNISQKELAELLDVSITTIDKYENGGLPNNKETAYLFHYDHLIAVFS